MTTQPSTCQYGLNSRARPEFFNHHCERPAGHDGKHRCSHVFVAEEEGLYDVRQSCVKCGKVRYD